LYDILSAIELIELFTRETGSFQEYQSDLKTKSAVERQLLILGEAVNQYSRVAPEFPLRNTKRIVSFRNRLAHDYSAIDDAIVWAVLTKHLQTLKEEVVFYLEKFK